MNLSYILKDARKSREENRLYFYSLILVFIVSYTVLSFDKSTISTFLYIENIFSINNFIIESFVLSILFLLTLIFFASKNQIENKKEEFAIFMMMGERRKNISKRIALESAINSLYALVIALPIALFLNEFINLFVIKSLELGLRTHRLRISFFALIISVVVVILLQIICIRILAFFTLRTEAYILINSKNRDYYAKEKKINEKKSLLISLLLFSLCSFLIYIKNYVTYPMIILFFVSLFLFYRGFSHILKIISQRNISKLFEIKLVEEKFKYEYKSLFLINCIMILAFTTLFMPLAQSFSIKGYSKSHPDFTIYDNEEAIRAMYSEEKYNKILEKPIPIYIKNVSNGDSEYIEAEIYTDFEKELFAFTTFVKESSLNTILEKQGKEILSLKDNEAMLLYSKYGYSHNIINKKLDDKSKIRFKDDTFYLINRKEANNLFSNYQVFSDDAIVINDKMYDSIVEDDKAFAYNLYIKDYYKNEIGTIKASDKIRDMMIGDKLKYESKVWQLKTDISKFLIELYTNLYFGVLLFIIANTYIAFKFLYWLKENKERFEIKRFLGADRINSKKQMDRIINYYFMFIYLISFAVSYVYYKFNIIDLVNKEVSNNLYIYINISLLLFEIIYIGIIKKMAREELEK